MTDNYFNPQELRQEMSEMSRLSKDSPLYVGARAAVALFCGAMALLVFSLAAMALLGSCTTVRETTSSVDRHRVERMMNRMDSLMHTRTVTQHDSAWRESVMREFLMIREKSDTNRTVTLNAAGDTIRERIIINNIRETASEKEQQEREVMMRTIEAMDSVINVMREHQSVTDSLLQQRERVTEKEVPAQLTWWQQARLWLSNAVLIALAVAAAVWLIRKRAWWLGLLLRK